MKKYKLLIIGHARHGKDTVAEILKEAYGYNFKSSSEAAAEIMIYDRLKEKYGYTSFTECFEDRMNHRAEWYELVCEYNKDDKARLAKDIMANNDIYVGMRSNEECQECMRQGVFDFVIGVFDPRKPLEPTSSFNIDLSKMSDFIIMNNDSIHALKAKITSLELFKFQLEHV